MARKYLSDFLAVALLSTLSSATAMAEAGYGDNADLALRSCQHLYASGVRGSGVYYLKPDGTQALTTYCDMDTQGGGWALVFNSVLGTNTTDFWNMSYAERFGRQGRPSLDSNFYDGSLYRYRKTEYVTDVQYMDVIEDLKGKTVVLFTARTDGFNETTMRFQNPVQINGNASVYLSHFASGWSARDYDGDTYSIRNCASMLVNVAQHYSDCFFYNLGADGDEPNEDGRVGPHVSSWVAAQLQLATDGTPYTRVRRISRFVRW